MAWCFEADATRYTEKILNPTEQGIDAWVSAIFRLAADNNLLIAAKANSVPLFLEP